MRGQLTSSPDDIDIVSLWGALRRSLPKLMIATLLVGTLTFGVLSLVAPRYASEAQLAIVSKSTNPFPDAGKLTGAPDAVTPRMDKEAMNTHVRALVAPDLLLRVADSLKLRENREFNSTLGSVDFLSASLRLLGLSGPRAGESEEDRVLGEVSKRLEVAVAKESRFIPIRFAATDPKLAADFANALAEAYRASLVSDTILETQQVVKALDPKIEQLRREVIEAETEVERYRVQIDRTIGGQTRTPLIDQRLAELTAELSRADALKSDADVKWRTAREMIATGNAEVLPDIQKSPLIQNLVQQRVRAERQISELSASLLPGHPRMQQLSADLSGLKRQIASEVQKQVTGIEKEAKVAALRVDAIARQLAELKGRVVASSGDDARLRAIEASAKAKRSELERLERQLEDNNTVVVTKSVPVEARIISPARTSSIAVFPKKGPFTLLAMAATMMLGLAWIVTRELLVGARPAASAGGSGGGSEKRALVPRPTLVEPKLVSAAPAAAISATEAAAVDAAPETATPAARTGTATPGPELPGADLTLASITSRIIDIAGPQGGFRTLVAGERAGIDVAAEGPEIARSLARAGKQVILVDWSLDGRGVAAALGAAAKPGITELLAGHSSFEDVVARMPGSDAHLIACGAALADPAALLDADGLNLVLDALDEAYDHIVVVAEYVAGQALFEAIQGRFDAGVTVAVGPERVSVLDQGRSAFLGFEVTDIEVMRFERPAPVARTSAKPVSKVVAPAGAAKSAPKVEPPQPNAAAATSSGASVISAKRLQMARGGSPAATSRPT